LVVSPASDVRGVSVFSPAPRGGEIRVFREKMPR
ncbi:hypothetical protein T4A_3211, partial [Trichinella pseudospiralis]